METRSELLHVAILRTVRAGKEEEFERALAGFFERAEKDAGTRGASVLRPGPGSKSREYGILRTFEHEAAKEAFYASTLYKDWQEQVSPLVEGPAQKRELHGLEAFFRDTSSSGPPAAWKMAILTWIAVNPAVWLYANGVPRVFGKLPGLVELLVVNVFVVATLTWVFMPLLTKVAGPWLAAPQEPPTKKEQA